MKLENAERSQEIVRRYLEVLEEVEWIKKINKVFEKKNSFQISLDSPDSVRQFVNAMQNVTDWRIQRSMMQLFLTDKIKLLEKRKKEIEDL